jgi:hypothetical protein
MDLSPRPCLYRPPCPSPRLASRDVRGRGYTDFPLGHSVHGALDSFTLMDPNGRDVLWHAYLEQTVGAQA